MDSAATTDELLRRLQALEGELIALRCDLGAASTKRDELPESDFQVLCCRVGDLISGIPLSRVREIVRYVEVTSVGAAESCGGVIDVRGEIVRVIDLRERFGADVAVFVRGTAIVLCQANDDVIGFVVDEVLGIDNVARETCATPGAGGSSAGVLAVAADRRGGVLQIADVNAIASTPNSVELAVQDANGGGEHARP